MQAKLTAISLFLLGILVFSNCSKEDDEGSPSDSSLQIVSARVGTVSLSASQTTEGVPLDQPVILSFSEKIDTSTIAQNVLLGSQNGEAVGLEFSYLDDFTTLSARPARVLDINTMYTLEVSQGLKGVSGTGFTGALYNFLTLTPPLILDSLTINGMDMLTSNRVQGVGLDFEIEAFFSHPVELENFRNNVLISSPGLVIGYEIEAIGNDQRAFRISATEPSPGLTLHTLRINNGLTAVGGNVFDGYSKRFYTQTDETPDFPLISDEELLTLVQEQTFKYFWDFGHPVSGLSRERNTSGNTVTSGGSGFGLMVIIVGIERGFITRQEGIDRLRQIVDFIGTADRFNGVWSHWLNGETGKAIPFSANDDGADLVETSYLAMGLLTFRQYLDPMVAEEQQLIEDINTLWEGIQWNWHTQGGQNVLYWHWSPNFGWEKNLSISGWNESLITYVLAAASPTYGIDAEVYHSGWARNGNMMNGASYYGIPLPLGPAFGGPLFFAHYTFMGIDPRNLEDQYANYWDQNIAHTLVNREHCIVNPLNYVGYGTDCWGLTASDGNMGYSAHSPNNDRGVITPTAALSSFPFTPEQSMEALHHFYYHLGDKLWGTYGFHDAFNLTEGWWASSFLAIDQGPIVVMIENHRTGLLWDLFMSCPEVQNGLDKLGFSY
jgi:hypothetical protein